MKPVYRVAQETRAIAMDAGREQEELQLPYLI